MGEKLGASSFRPTRVALILWRFLYFPPENGQRAVEFLLANLDSVSMPKLAHQAGMSERSLRRHFRAETGTSIGSYLGHARTIKAMQLLIDDRGSVSEVSISVGFNNPSAFSCAFRRATGMSPVEFRGASGDSSKL